MRFIINWIISFGIIELVSIILVFLNVLTFFLYMLDKQKAARNKWRIRESTLIFFTIVCGGIGALLGMYFAKHKTRKRKFKLAVIIGLIVTLIPIAHIIHGLTLDRMIRYVEIEFRSENWPTELDGYRIAFITDMHTITDEDMRKVAVELNKKDLDLLLLGGDLLSIRNSHYQGTLREIAQINARDGIFGVEGNHDDHTRLFSAMEQYGIMPLDNSGTHIHSGFYLAGVHDMWKRNPDMLGSITGANADDFVLLISHNPDVTMEQSTSGIDLILSGHTHAGQITFFGFPMYLLLGSITEYGTRFAHGFAYSADKVPVFVSSGIGDYFTVPRIFARPEVAVFTMYTSK